LTASERLKLAEIQSVLHNADDLVLNGTDRKFIQEGDISYFGPKLKDKSAHYFLFDDLMIATNKIKGGKYDVVARFPLEGAEVVSKDLAGRFTFEIVLNQSEQSTPNFLLITDTSEERDRWISQLEYLISKLSNGKKTVKPTMDIVPDTKDTQMSRYQSQQSQQSQHSQSPQSQDERREEKQENEEKNEKIPQIKKEKKEIQKEIQKEQKEQREKNPKTKRTKRNSRKK